ncbi:DUF1661 domain-containing protein [Porphyromonas gingivalis]|nr:DUF1661 domain-containing protein [Porphyromonas gingivalis]
MCISTSFSSSLTSPIHLPPSCIYVPEFSSLLSDKMWRVKFFVLAREVKNLRAITKKISRHFCRKHERQSEHFSLVILEAVSYKHQASGSIQ